MSSNYVAWFADLSADDLPRAGGKGANLGELTRADFPVPPGFVITTDAYRLVAEPLHERILAAAAGDPDDAASIIGHLFEQAAIPDELATAIIGAHTELTRGMDAESTSVSPTADAVAVRSSATAEDLPDASFAGLQDTYLNIRGPEALLDAVRRCWASLWTARAIAYRRRLGIDPAEVALAVVIQALVDAEASGIAFSIDPATGRTDRIAIDATWGLGEAIVSGRVTPDHLLLDKTTHEIVERTTSDKAVRTVRSPEGTHEEPVPDHLRRAEVLDETQAAGLASLIADVERHYGRPQDVEWARDASRTWLVQARPVTAVGEPVGDVPTEWSVTRTDAWYFRASIVEQMPDPLTPLFGDLISPAVFETVLALMENLAGPGAMRPGEGEFARINGYGYLAYGKKAMGRLTVRALPGIVKMVRDPERSSEKLWTRMHADYEAAIAAAEQRPPDALGARELLDEVRRLVHAGAGYYTSVQTVIPQAGLAETSFRGAYAVLGRLRGIKAEDFLLGADSEPIRADKALWDLARWVRTRPGLSDAVGASLDWAASAREDAPAGVDPADWAEWRRRLAEHLGRYGHTLYNLDFVNPVPADDPAPILEALRYYLTDDAASPYDRQARLLARRRMALASLRSRGGVRAKMLNGLLGWHETYGPMREDALADVGLAWPRMRHDLAELGARFAEAGLIATASDVFWLTEDEARAAASQLDSGATELTPNALVEERKAAWRGQKLARPPQLLPLGGSKLWDRFMPSVEQQSGDELKGLGSSGGVVTGPARVIRGTADFATMRRGEVLVAEITTPAYTPLFALASAVVTDVGGPLSHSSIVAREYGIPAVLGTGSATARIETGDTITVDGTAGVVRLGRPG